MPYGFSLVNSHIGEADTIDEEQIDQYYLKNHNNLPFVVFSAACLVKELFCKKAVLIEKSRLFLHTYYEKSIALQEQGFK